jgi:hypothetical protein
MRLNMSRPWLSAPKRNAAQAHVVGIGIERRDPRGEDRCENDDQQEQGGGRRRRIAQDASPHGILAPQRRDGLLVGLALKGEGGVGHALLDRGHLARS